MTPDWVAKYKAMQQLNRQFSDTTDVAEKLDIRKRQKAVLRSFNPPPLTVIEKYSAVIVQDQ